jgi:hypothetical protein
MKCFMDFNKEEAWLKEMANKGNKFTGKTSMGYYIFDRIPEGSGDYTYRIDYRTFSYEQDFKNYCAMFEDFGWLHLAGTKCSGSQYFVKIKPDAGDDIFSDDLSRAGRYKRISSMWLSLTLAYTAIFFSILVSYRPLAFNKIYITPGLWEMKGWRFILQFLIETPFALLRLSPLIIYPAIVIFYVYYTVKSYSLYKKELAKH